MSKLWSGRIQAQTDEMVNAFTESISIDARMYKQDIEGSMAHAMMLGAKNIIPQKDVDAIIKALEEILHDIEDGKVELDKNAEDIHMNIEVLLTKRIGEPGRRIHTARSRNDQVALDMQLYVKNEIKAIIQAVLGVQSALVDRAAEHIHSIMPGYTHLQRAQPVTLAHHLMAYVSMFDRDISRLQDCDNRMAYCPLGAGALAATTYPIDNFATAKALGFDKPYANSMDAVSDRDFCIELLSDLSIIMMHLSRLSEEIIFWCSWECRFAEPDDAFATGSSIMPQKKNPDIAELTRGKTGRVYGSLITVLTIMKGLPLSYNRDMQEDKETVFDAIDTVKACLFVMSGMIKTLIFKPDNMRKAVAEGFLNATDCADYLVKKGLPFRDAYGIVGRLVNDCIKKGCILEDLPLEELKDVCPIFEEDVYDAINLEHAVNARNVYGGPSPTEVEKMIGVAKGKIC